MMNFNVYFTNLRVFWLLLAVASALDNGVGQLPLLGWNSWCAFGPCGTDVCSAQEVLDTITAMQMNGMKDAGYEYITLDDCFAMHRNSTTNEMYPDLERFPDGFAPVVQAAHDAGFKFGIYTSAGDMTCHAKKYNCTAQDPCNIGSLGHYSQDASTFAKWELDFIKMDWCSKSVANLSCKEQYGQMAKSLNATRRPIVFYMSCGGKEHTSPWTRQVSNIWRIGFDHLDCWSDGPCSQSLGYTSKGHGTKQAIEYLTGFGVYQAPGGYGTPDFLKTGGESCNISAIPGRLCPHQTLVEYRTEITMWVRHEYCVLIHGPLLNLSHLPTFCRKTCVCTNRIATLTIITTRSLIFFLQLLLLSFLSFRRSHLPLF